MAWPLAAQNVFAQGSFYISMAFAGRLGRESLSAAVLGTSILNVTGFAALAGLASAMETLCGQVNRKLFSSTTLRDERISYVRKGSPEAAVLVGEVCH